MLENLFKKKAIGIIRSESMEADEKIEYIAGELHKMSPEILDSFTKKDWEEFIEQYDSDVVRADRSAIDYEIHREGADKALLEDRIKTFALWDKDVEFARRRLADLQGFEDNQPTND